jgi:hypothetical protein
VKYKDSGVVISNEGGELGKNNSPPEIIRLVTGGKLNNCSDLENHILDDLDNHILGDLDKHIVGDLDNHILGDFDNHILGDLDNHILDDLDSHWGEVRGYSHPPSLTSMHHNALINDYRFIPLEENEMYQDPESRAAVSELWGARELGDHNVHNFNSYRIPVSSGFNIPKLKKLAAGYWDEQLFELLKYGFPLDVGTGFMPSNNQYNHSSADNYPDHVGNYINKETVAGALKRLDGNLFKFQHISPLMSRPKDSNGRRIILDLSWPQQTKASINACVPVDSYLNKKFIFKLPTVDNIVSIVNSFSTSVHIFKIDLARAFRQTTLDPLDVAFLGIRWQGTTYFDTTVPFGWRHGSAACQRITDAICFILKSMVS